MLDLLIEGSSRFVTTPHVLAETSNLLVQQVGEKERRRYLAALAQAISALNEQFTAANELAKAVEFLDLGLTDAGIIRLFDSRAVILTTDSRLAASLLRRGLFASNFNHLRDG